jgi:hypothetical protein
LHLRGIAENCTGGALTYLPHVLRYSSDILIFRKIECEFPDPPKAEEEDEEYLNPKRNSA